VAIGGAILVSRSVCEDLRERGATGTSSLILVGALVLRLGCRGEACFGADVAGGGVGALGGAEDVSSESKFIIDMGLDERTGAGKGGAVADSWLGV
jgi:hypothetical protein